MLMQPTLEKLYSMKLMGMVEAIRRQMEDPESRTAQLRRTTGHAGGSAMGLASEQSPHSAHEESAFQIWKPPSKTSTTGIPAVWTAR